MADQTDQSNPTKIRSHAAGPFGFTRRETIALVTVAVILGGISAWTWWGKHRAAATRYWTVEDVVVDTLLLAHEEGRQEPSENDAAVVMDDPGHVLIDVNTAGIEELIRLPGIGPVLAQRVVAARQADGPFTSLEDLQRVRGIGASTAADLDGWVRFSRQVDTLVASDGHTE